MLVCGFLPLVMGKTFRRGHTLGIQEQRVRESQETTQQEGLTMKVRFWLVLGAVCVVLLISFPQTAAQTPQTGARLHVLPSLYRLPYADAHREQALVSTLTRIGIKNNGASVPFAAHVRPSDTTGA